MPEVLRLVARLNLGGPARHVLRIHAPLAALGFRTTLVTGHVDEGEQDLLPAARAAGLDPIVLAGLGRRPAPGADLATLLALRRLLLERRPALLHTHTAKAGTLGRLAAWTLGSRRPALVHSFHGHVLKGYFGTLASGAATAVERVLARGTDRLIAVSPRVRDELRALGVGRSRSWAVVPPGIDFERTRPDRPGGERLRAEIGCPPGTVLVGLVGRLARVKDPLAAVAAFRARGAPAQRAHLLVMGDGELGPALRAALAGQHDATWLPPRDDLRAVWGALDLCLMTSRAEGLPQVATEALAAGVPVLATDVGGLRDLVDHGRNGLLVRPEDLAPTLARLLADRPCLAALAQGCAGFDPTSHGAAAVAKALAAVYADAFACRGGPRALEDGPAPGHAAAPCGW